MGTTITWGLASRGIEEMTDTDGTGALRDELETAMEAEHACPVLPGKGVDSPGSTEIEFPIDLNDPLVTLTTMVAPSPDWFVGVRGLDLRNADGASVDSQTVDPRTTQASIAVAHDVLCGLRQGTDSHWQKSSYLCRVTAPGG